eukprot:909569-Rhodomonas_salina.1
MAELILELAEGCSAGVCPGKSDVLGEEREERHANVGVAVDEAAVVVGKPKEGAEVVLVSGFRPVTDAFGLGRVDGDAIFRDNVTKKGGRTREELTLAGLCTQAVG